MLRQQVKPLELGMRKEKKKDYKSIVAEIQNEGQEFDAQSRTDNSARLAQQAFSLRKPPRGRNN